jgi:hypothetical protein
LRIVEKSYLVDGRTPPKLLRFLGFTDFGFAIEKYLLGQDLKMPFGLIDTGLCLFAYKDRRFNSDFPRAKYFVT